MEAQFVFAATIEGLFVRALGEKLDASARARLKEAGLDLGRPLLAAYPFDVWMETIRIGAEAIYPDRDAKEARFELGKDLVAGYRHTYIGRIMLSLAKTIGPTRTLEYAASYFRTGNNYTETRFSPLGSNEAELWMNEVGPYPEFTAGIVHAGVVNSGAREVKVEVVAHDGHAASFRIAWSE